MIDLERTGFYKLIETKSDVKILYLDNQIFAWVKPAHIGEILVVSHKVHRTDCVLALGHYNLYSVTDEPNLSDNPHLELETGHNSWQGYLLLTGLPTGSHPRARIIPTHEIITDNPRFKGERRRIKSLTKR